MGTNYLYEIHAIRAGLEQLLTDDPVFSRMGINVENLSWPYFGTGFSSFVRIVCGQQVSTSAAKAIWEKVQANLAPITPANLVKQNEDLFRASGLSQSKTNYIKGLAQEIINGAFDIEALEKQDDNNVTETITALKGFGPWSAEIYLMFCLARPDIWPAGDLGIQEGLRRYHDLAERPTIEETKEMGAFFTPHRTAASILLWKLKSLD